MLFNLKDSTLLSLRCIGYSPTEYLITSAVKNKRLILELSAETTTLEEVVISSQREKSFETLDHIGRLQLDPSLANVVPTTAERDVFRMIQHLPGVGSTDELSAGLEINGGESTQSLILFDGYSIYHLDHFLGYFSAINADAVKSFRLFKTGYGAKYGGRSSSILEFTGNDGNLDKVGGKLSINPISFSTALEVPVSDKTSLFMAARRSYADIIPTYIFENIIDQFNNNFDDTGNPAFLLNESSFEPDFYYNDLNLKVSSRVGPRDMLSFSFYDSDDLLNYSQYLDIGMPQDTILQEVNIGRTNWGNLGVSAKFSRIWNHNHYTEFLSSYSNYTSSYYENSTQTFIHRPSGNDFTQTALVNQTNSISDYTFDVEHEVTLSDGLIEVGLQNKIYSTDVSSTYDNEVVLDKQQENIGLFTQYANYTLNLRKTAKLEVGVRNNYLTSTGQFYLEPRISYSANILPSIRFTGAYGYYRQFINQIDQENALEGSRDLWVVSDFEIPDQLGTHYLAGLSFELPIGTLQTNFYAKAFDRIIAYAFQSGSLITEFSNYSQLFFSGKGKARGLEILLKEDLDRFSGWIGYTHNNVQYLFDGLNDGNWYAADHDQKHELNVYASYQYKKWSFAATWLYGSGTPFTDWNTIKSQTRDQSKGVNVRIIVPGEKNGERLPSYNRLDLSTSYATRLGNTDFSITASLFNVFDQVNTVKVEYENAPSQDGRNNNDGGNGNEANQDGPGGGDSDGPGGGMDDNPPPPDDMQNPPDDGLLLNNIQGMGFTPSLTLTISF